MGLSTGHLVPKSLILMFIMYCTVSPSKCKLEGLEHTLYDWDGEKSPDEDSGLAQVMCVCLFHKMA